MAIDAYSLCPGGTGKKIKFCCGDFLGELQKIDRMYDGEQYLACLKHIEHLLEQEPGRDRACLLATKCEVLYLTNQPEAARKTAASFLAKHPNNQLALAESAMIAAERDARRAFDLIQRALCAAAGTVLSRTYHVIGFVAGALLREGLAVPARALFQLMCEIAEEHDDRPLELLSAISQTADIPLLLRENPPLVLCPDDAAWKDRLTEVMKLIGVADWQTAAERLAALAVEVPDSPAIWRNLATVRGWLADNRGCIDALRKYASLRAREPDGLEDAVEAEATAMFLASDPLGDHQKLLKLVWTVKDVDAAQERFLSSPRLRAIQIDLSRFGDGQTPPPKAAYLLLDRPVPETAEGLRLEAVPRRFGQALLFGRQTDREARCEVTGVLADELPAVVGLIREVAGDSIAPQANQEVVGQWSASQRLLQAAWQLPPGTSPEQVRKLASEHQREAILSRWPDLKLGILDGRSPRERAGEESCRVRVLAAIMVLEHLAGYAAEQIDFNELRSRLGLPVLGPIDPRQQAVTEVPLARLGRMTVEGLSDDDLIAAFYRAGAFAIRPATRKFALAIIGRPSLSGRDEQGLAYANLARTEHNIDQALVYIDQGRRAAEARKRPGGSWDLMELSFRFAQRNGPEVMRLIDHLQRHHLEEPGVGEALDAHADRRGPVESGRDAGHRGGRRGARDGGGRSPGRRAGQTLDAGQCRTRQRRWKVVDAGVAVRVQPSVPSSLLRGTVGQSLDAVFLSWALHKFVSGWRLVSCRTAQES